jgi:very-short-patch-repair endonuclease
MFWQLVRMQLGLISRRQARTAGADDGWLARSVGSGELDLILPTVFRHRAALRTLSQLTLGVSLWLDGRGAVGSTTAARLMGLDRIPDESFVRVRGSVSRSPSSDVLVVRSPLAPHHVAAVGKVVVTSPARTLCDLAGDVNALRLHSAMESAFRMGLCTPEDVEAVATDMGPRGWKGRGRVLRWLDDRSGSAAMDSELELRTWRLLVGSGLELPVRQHPVTVDGDTYLLDFAWPARRLALECEGRRYHDIGDPFEPDRVRRAALASVGFRVLPATWREVTRHGDRLIDRVRAAIATSR